MILPHTSSVELGKKMEEEKQVTSGESEREKGKKVKTLLINNTTVVLLFMVFYNFSESEAIPNFMRLLNLGTEKKVRVFPKGAISNQFGYLFSFAEGFSKFCRLKFALKSNRTVLFRL